MRADKKSQPERADGGQAAGEQRNDDAGKQGQHQKGEDPGREAEQQVEAVCLRSLASGMAFDTV